MYTWDKRCEWPYLGSGERRLRRIILAECDSWYDNCGWKIDKGTLEESMGQRNGMLYTE